jgi:hypothetical protein
MIDSETQLMYTKRTSRQPEVLKQKDHANQCAVMYICAHQRFP